MESYGPPQGEGEDNRVAWKEAVRFFYGVWQGSGAMGGAAAYAPKIDNFPVVSSVRGL